MRTTEATTWLATALVCTAVVAAACTENAGQLQQPPGRQATTPPGALTSIPSAGTPSTTGGTIQIGLTGTWSGTWANSSGDTTGTLDLTWRQADSKLTGMITVNGTFCLTGGLLTGEVSGNRIEFGLIGLAQRNVELKYEGTVSGQTVSGTYSTTCDNTTGTWRLTKTG